MSDAIKKRIELCEAATKGKWEYTRIDCDEYMSHDVVMRGNSVICEPTPYFHTKPPEIFPDENNGEYIAAHSPDVMIAIYEELMAARELLDSIGYRDHAHFNAHKEARARLDALLEGER